MTEARRIRVKVSSDDAGAISMSRVQMREFSVAELVELIASVMAIKDGVIPPTINVDDQDPECDLDVVPNVAREVPVKVALSNSFGFGGHNASVLVSKYE